MEMTNSADPDSSEMCTRPRQIVERQRDVQRSLGRCMLRLQQYEKLLKALLRETSFTGTVCSDGLLTLVRHNQADDKTLGALVRMFLGSVIRERNEPEDGLVDIAAAEQQRTSFSSQFSIAMESEQRESVENALKELVKIRNELVHHFIDKFDVWSEDGCVAAVVYLNATFKLIDTLFHELRGWAKSIDTARKHAADFVSSSAFVDFLDGIEPDETVL